MSNVKGKGSHVEVVKWTSEWPSLLLQFVLYTLQGIPMGLSSSIPLVLISNERVSVSQLGAFAGVALPFSVKILWAPVVDCLSIERFGRRKCWLIPVQIICGLLMIIMGRPSWWDFDDDDRPIIDQWLEPENPNQLPEIGKLSWLFLVFYFLMATQDIVVDAWAISMLSKPNRGLASTMNTLGQSFGVIVGNTLFLALRDPTTMERLFASHDVITLGSFTGYCGVMMVLISLLLPFKRESSPHVPSTITVHHPDGIEMTGSSTPSQPEHLHEGTTTVESSAVQRKTPNRASNSIDFDDAKLVRTPEVDDEDEDEYNVFGESTLQKITNAYVCVGKMASMRPILSLGLVLLMTKIPFAAADRLTVFELIKGGLTKEAMAMLSPTVMAVGFLAPIAVSGLAHGISTAEKFRLLSRSFRLRLLTIPLSIGIVIFVKWWFSFDDAEGDSPSMWQPLSLYLMYNIIMEFMQTTMFVTQMTVFNEVTDARIGGIYMTFLNTLANVGALSTGYLVYPLLDVMPWSNHIAPFHTLCIASLLIGVLLIGAVERYAMKLGKVPHVDWLVDLSFVASRTAKTTTISKGGAQE